LSKQFAASADYRFEFPEGSQLFIGVHNEPLSVVAMGVSSPGCPPVGIARHVSKRQA
jgi:hypothetical protein